MVGSAQAVGPTALPEWGWVFNFRFHEAFENMGKFFVAVSPLVILVVIATSCCPAADRAKPAYWDFGERYFLRLHSVIRRNAGSAKSLSISEGPDFDDSTQDEITLIRLGTTTHQFFFDIRNLSKEPLLVLWDQGYYEGEARRRFALGHRPLTSLAGSVSNKSGEAIASANTTVRSGELIRESVFVPEKIYKVRSSCFVDYVLNEPLIPETLAGQTVESIRQTARRLREDGKSVAVILPIRVENEIYQYEFRFVLGDNPNAPP